MTVVALTIAGSDPSGGAGLQADLKTFHQHGVYGMSVVTLLTVQNTRGVSEVHVLDPAFVVDQWRAVVDDIVPAAAKTGALGSAAVIEAIGRELTDQPFPLVVDPVMISKHGDPLLEPDARRALRTHLLPHAYLVTPNLHEAGALADMDVRDRAAMEVAAERIARQGAANVLVKGGGLADQCIDVLYTGGTTRAFVADRLTGRGTHGTGCVLSAAIVARLACGEELASAVEQAKAFVTRAIDSGPGLGEGLGPVNLFAATIG